MLTKEYILEIFKKHKAHFTDELGVARIGLFGSYARGNQKPESDVDVLVEMPADFTNLCAVWKILEKELKTKIDLVRVGPHLGKPFLQDIGKEIIYA
jgi:predicted nucleotidyltransferase